MLSGMMHRIQTLAATITLVATTALTGCAVEADDYEVAPAPCLDDCVDVANRTDVDAAYLASLTDLSKAMSRLDLSGRFPSIDPGDVFQLDASLAETVVVAQDGELDDTGRALLDAILRDSIEGSMDWAMATLATRADDAEALSPLEKDVLAKLEHVVDMYMPEIPTEVPGQNQ
jgi:hypothetical protein